MAAKGFGRSLHSSLGGNFDVSGARLSIVLQSILAISLLFVFLILAPAIGYPLKYGQAYGLSQIVLPVFFGYLGLASNFLTFKTNPKGTPVRSSGALSLIIVGPFAVFFSATFVLFFAFYLGNRESASPGTGMSFDDLSRWMTAILGLFTVTVGIIASSLFGTRPESGGEASKLPSNGLSLPGQAEGSNESKT